MRSFEFEAIGTKITCTIWDELTEDDFQSVNSRVVSLVSDFENKYSRFRQDSLLTWVGEVVGEVDVPEDFVNILKIYRSLYHISNKKFTPLIGQIISDLGYDKDFSFQSKREIDDVPDFDKVIKIISDNKIYKTQKCKFDFGAVGKGYVVDLISRLLIDNNMYRYMINAGGDIYYSDLLRPVKIGLEHPTDNTKIIGLIHMTRGAICGSSTQKRKWNNYSHYIDPDSKDSDFNNLAVWVKSDSCAYADAIASVLFFVDPEYVTGFDFEYCIIDNDNNIKYSAGFGAEYF